MHDAAYSCSFCRLYFWAIPPIALVFYIIYHIFYNIIRMSENTANSTEATTQIPVIEAPHRFSPVDPGEVRPTVTAITTGSESVVDADAIKINTPIEVPEPGRLMRGWLVVRRKTREDYERDYRWKASKLQEMWLNKDLYPFATAVKAEAGLSEEVIQQKVDDAEQSYRSTMRRIGAGAAALLGALTAATVFTVATTGTKYISKIPGIPDNLPAPSLFGEGEPSEGEDSPPVTQQTRETGTAPAPTVSPTSLPSIPGQTQPNIIPLTLISDGQGGGSGELTTNPVPSSPPTPETTIEETPEPTTPPTTEESLPSPGPEPTEPENPQTTESLLPQDDMPAGP